MKRRRVEFDGWILMAGESRQKFLSIGMENASVEKWLSLLWAFEFGFGDVVVVPREGLKCRILAIGPEAKIDTTADGIAMTLSRDLFKLMAHFLANHYYRQVSVNHFDYDLTIDSVPGCGLVFGLRHEYLTPELRPDEAPVELFRGRRH